jgi:hypothetical protein
MSIDTSAVHAMNISLHLAEKTLIELAMCDITDAVAALCAQQVVQQMYQL